MERALWSPPWQETTVRTTSIPSSASLRSCLAILRVYFCSSVRLPSRGYCDEIYLSCGEVRRIPLLRTPVHKGIRRGRGPERPGLLRHLEAYLGPWAVPHSPFSFCPNHAGLEKSVKPSLVTMSARSSLFPWPVGLSAGFRSPGVAPGTSATSPSGWFASAIELAQSADSTIGWIVADAGPATAIINAMTMATVTSKMMRFIKAQPPSLERDSSAP